MNTKVHGYTEQGDLRVNLVNSHKEMEERLLRILESYAAQGNDVFDMRWLAVAKTHFEEGFMCLNRAVFRPQRLNLPEDVKDGGPVQ